MARKDWLGFKEEWWEQGALPVNLPSQEAEQVPV